MSKLRLALVLLAALPLSCFGGVLVANAFLEPRFEPVDLSDPPLDLSVLAAWTTTDGDVRCRVFYHRDLVRYGDSLPELRYALSDADMARCSESIEVLRRDGAWSDAFSWDRRAYAVAADRPDPEDPLVFEVLYMSDDDRFNETRYRVDSASGEPERFEFRASFGPARGVGALSYGVPAGTLAWIGLALWLLQRARSRRRADQATLPTVDVPQ